MEPNIIFEDNDVIVCYKPAGMATQTQDVDAMDMVNWLRNYRQQKGEDTYVGVLQRLDQPVEGILAFAKNPKAAGVLTRQVHGNVMRKHYYAIVTNPSLPPEGVMVDYMVKNGRTNRSMVVNSADPRAKMAQLTYRVAREYADERLLDITIETGRHHQIRVQLASRMAPIVGDTKYGGISTGRPLDLCAYKIEFNHPVTNEHMEFTCAPQGEDFKEMDIK